MEKKINTTKLKEELYKFLLNKLYNLPNAPKCDYCKHSDPSLSKGSKCYTCKNRNNFKFSPNYEHNLKLEINKIINIAKENNK